MISAIRAAGLFSAKWLLPFNPKSKWEWRLFQRRGIIAMRRKAVLKLTQSKRWREVWCGPASAKRPDCVRFIAALSRSFHTRSAAKILHDCPPPSGFAFKASGAEDTQTIEALRRHQRRNFELDNESSPFYNASVNQDRLNLEKNGLNTRPPTKS